MRVATVTKGDGSMVRSASISALLVAWQASCVGARGDDLRALAERDAGEPRAGAVVNGFHGYAWGTPRSDIPEMADAASEDTFDPREDSYVIEVSLLGLSGYAAFFFDAASDELVQGSYLLEMDLTNCESKWEEFEGALEESFPGLETQKRRPTRDASERRMYDSDCEFLVYNDDREQWLTRFLHPTSQEIQLGMAIMQVQLTPQLGIFYRSTAAVDRAREREEEDRGILGPVQPN